MINLNLIGNVGHSPKLQTAKSGAEFYTFSVGVSKGKDKQSQWIDVTLSKDYGDKIAQYIVKGIKVYVSGNPSIKSWKSKEGDSMGSLCVYASMVELLSRKENTEESKPNELETDIPF